MLLQKGKIIWVKPVETKSYSGGEWNERKVWLELMDSKKHTRVWVVDKTKNLDYIFGEAKNLEIFVKNVNFTIQNFKKRDGTYGAAYCINRYEISNEELGVETFDASQMVKEQVKELDMTFQPTITEKQKEEIDWFDEITK